MSSVLQESKAALKSARNIVLLAVYRRNSSADLSGPPPMSQIALGFAYALRFSQVIPTRFSAYPISFI